ncbi:MAG: Pr6Pr family membrane protein [Promethearchaeota archaeon]
MNEMKNIIYQKYVNIYRLILCVLEWTALVIMFIKNILEQSLSYKTFSFFTFQSNLLVALWLTMTLLYYKKESKPKLLHYGVHGAITLYISMTFLIFAILLAPLSPPPTDPVYAFTNLMHHYLIPVAFILDWLITEFINNYEWIYILYWLIYPLGYLIYALIIGWIFNDAIYPFFDVNMLGIGGLLIFIVGLTIFVILLSIFYIFINHLSRIIYNKIYNKSTSKK